MRALAMEPNSDLQSFVNDCMKRFYARRKASLASLNLLKILKRKNPYVLRAEGVRDPRELIEGLLDSHIKESDEGIFGETVFEAVALWACRDHGGRKSGADRVDIEIHTPGKVKAIAVKSSPNWGNSSQWEQLRSDLSTLQVKLRALDKHFEPIAGHGSGQAAGWYKNYIRKVSGQAFWHEISGDPHFYLRLMRAIDRTPPEFAAVFEEARSKALEAYVREFRAAFCGLDGAIDWERWVVLNSGPKVARGGRGSKGKERKLAEF
jgi:hypothetical protein